VRSPNKSRFLHTQYQMAVRVSPVPAHYSAYGKAFTDSFDPHAGRVAARQAFNPLLAHPRYPPEPTDVRPTKTEYRAAFHK
jgi:hypothetical protein